MEQKRVLLTICGRAGSKGFRNKNLKTFNGYPLAHYSLSAAMLFIESRPDVAVDICVNTDSEPLVEIITAKYPAGICLCPFRNLFVSLPEFVCVL